MVRLNFVIAQKAMARCSGQRWETGLQNTSNSLLFGDPLPGFCALFVPGASWTRV